MAFLPMTGPPGPPDRPVAVVSVHGSRVLLSEEGRALKKAYF
ncbi:MAG TPA: hypothetical protein VE990_10305 [Acidimicrobiales bacterium]|nr:hypothetical protein [Acidimicrobiales bacterium]